MKNFLAVSVLYALIVLLGDMGNAAAKTNPIIKTTTTVYAISPDGLGESLGTLTMHDNVRGLVIVPNLKNLAPGQHGFHLHENANCSPGLKDDKMVAGLGAGGHFDPDQTGTHEGPMGEGHRGDLPALNVESDGTAHKAILVPHLKLADLTGHAFIIHEGGDNYSDQPKPLGGGGNRIACAVVF